MEKIITKKDETIKYNIDYIKKNLELGKFIELLEKKCFADTYFDESGYPKEHTATGFRYTFLDCALISCINESNKDPNLKNNTSLPVSWTEFAVLNWFFSPYEPYLDGNDPTKDPVYITKKEYKKDSNEFDKKCSLHIAEGNLLEKISSNFELSYDSIKISETLEQFKDGNFYTHSIIYSKVNKKYYYIYNDPSEAENLIGKIYDELIPELEFVEMIIDKAALNDDKYVIRDDGFTIGELRDKID